MRATREMAQKRKAQYQFIYRDSVFFRGGLRCVVSILMLVFIGIRRR